MRPKKRKRKKKGLHSFWAEKFGKLRKNQKVNWENSERKHDTIGYRINPDDISKSLIKPSDISYLDETESADYLDKWKSLKELRKQPFKNKRFKLYR